MNAPAPLGNANAPLAKGRREKLLELAQSNSRSAFPQGCQHRFRRVEFLPPGSTHHAKEICDDCGAFLGWAAKLENLERRLGDSCRIAKLLMRPDLTVWERNFLKSIGTQKKLSPKQQAVVDRLAAQYLEAKAP
jgi:hypothetical protein